MSGGIFEATAMSWALAFHSVTTSARAGCVAAARRPNRAIPSLPLIVPPLSRSAWKPLRFDSPDRRSGSSSGATGFRLLGASPGRGARPGARVPDPDGPIPPGRGEEVPVGIERDPEDAAG